VASVHDEIVLEVAEAEADIAAEILTEAMTTAFERTFPGAPTRNVVEVKIGPTWAHLK
jgi:DNA polymerase I-like protein with 3'-5' exonuclease and polymerase domains